MSKLSPLLAPAKINLYLHVVGKRADGFHLLDSLIVFAETGDYLSISPHNDLALDIDGPFSAGLKHEANNLVLRAARGLAEIAGVDARARIRLTKNLPIASGIGGGSADAAATLRALVEFWQLDVDTQALLDLALRLGADVPVCLDGRSSFVGGIGEELMPAGQLPPAWLVLANPRVPTPTPKVFKARRGDFSGEARWSVPPTDAAALATYLKGRRNDLTEAAITVAPVIRDVLTLIETTGDCLVARLSGSGATCFGLYGNAAAAETAAAEIRRRRPNWWVVPAPLKVH
ncbi:4-(cytidine 5'-diphospho)-2-C-methyl-D-erythritol kinase [Dongia soli]|uniref:4-diphosphocytidyl-2-C-methyl-D-erythritol kinase n=1 Tax=Dongia soli TaxID=600628 RepID=A0ABU5EC51_9PROT|nr:4-(cytidine 5'-diphospho)-2-C-methyl-D-erythritol kinase [Dongia soli]MDY0883930.1 4-(cytidine 5'-diphospho)-2-C-methyl-D-erythritol kinase [Dongia soli]